MESVLDLQALCEEENSSYDVTVVLHECEESDEEKAVVKENITLTETIRKLVVLLDESTDDIDQLVTDKHKIAIKNERLTAEIQRQGDMLDYDEADLCKLNDRLYKLHRETEGFKEREISHQSHVNELSQVIQAQTDLLTLRESQIDIISKVVANKEKEVDYWYALYMLEKQANVYVRSTLPPTTDISDEDVADHSV